MRVTVVIFVSQIENFQCPLEKDEYISSSMLKDECHFGCWSISDYIPRSRKKEERNNICGDKDENRH